MMDDDILSQVYQSWAKLSITEGNDYYVEHEDELPYRLLKNLGHGHSGTVEQVEDITTGNIFARKVIRMPRSRAGIEKKRVFENEIRIIRNLREHHHIVRVFATYVAKHEVGLILLPVADEGDLENFLHKFWDDLNDPIARSLLHPDPIPIMASVLERSFGCLASGLAFMHRQRIRHKDIKPRNILIHQGTVVYTDFGYSLDSSMKGSSTTTGRPEFLTRKYAAPEVIDFEPRNSQSDVFSLGCVFFDILSAITNIFEVDSVESFHESIQSIHAEIAGLSYPDPIWSLATIAVSMTSFDPSQRPTANQVLDQVLLHPELSCLRCYIQQCAADPEITPQTERILPPPRPFSESSISEVRPAWNRTRERIDSWILDTVSCSNRQKLIMRNLVSAHDLDYHTWWRLVNQHWDSDSPDSPPLGMENGESYMSRGTVYPSTISVLVSLVNENEDTGSRTSEKAPNLQPSLEPSRQMPV